MENVSKANTVMLQNGTKAVVLASYDNGNVMLVQECTPNPLKGPFHIVKRENIRQDAVLQSKK